MMFLHSEVDNVTDDRVHAFRCIVPTRNSIHHLLRSLKKSPYRAVVTPARCRKCGFCFHDDKLHKPGKCPRCRETWISEPLIEIRERAGGKG